MQIFINAVYSHARSIHIRDESFMIMNIYNEKLKQHKYSNIKSSF